MSSSVGNGYRTRLWGGHLGSSLWLPRRSPHPISLAAASSGLSCNPMSPVEIPLSHENGVIQCNQDKEGPGGSRQWLHCSQKASGLFTTRKPCMSPSLVGSRLVLCLLVEPILSVKPEIPYFRQTLSLCSSSGVWGGGCSGTIQNKLVLSLEFFQFQLEFSQQESHRVTRFPVHDLIQASGRSGKASQVGIILPFKYLSILSPSLYRLCHLLSPSHCQFFSLSFFRGATFSKLCKPEIHSLMSFYTTTTTNQMEIQNIPSFTAGHGHYPPKDSNYSDRCHTFLLPVFELHINRNTQYIFSSVVGFIHVVCLSKLLFHCCIMFHCVDIPWFICPFFSSWTFGLFPAFCYYK